MLERLSADHVEPFGELDVALSPRLNLILGDNGLGKTFLLDLAWWACTSGDWPGYMALPQRRPSAVPFLSHRSHRQESVFDTTYLFDASQQHWTFHKGEIGSWHLVLYARADGGFEIWDPYRPSGPYVLRLGAHALGPSNRFHLGLHEIWDGLDATDGTPLCNGIIRDWVTWQFQRPEIFKTFAAALEGLSPDDHERLRPGRPRRVSVEDVRDIPTLQMPYGDVPVTHASAGMRRVMAVAYALVWMWYEHTQAAEVRGVEPLAELVVLIDEIDAHLHPRWQRVILPALFKVVPQIAQRARVQVLTSTHAPLVLASVETLFDPTQDRILHLDLVKNRIVLEALPWAKQGDAANWLVSESFGLRQARSREAEVAIEAAEALMRGETPAAPLGTKEAIHAELLRTLAGHDPFWPRWIVATGAGG